MITHPWVVKKNPRNKTKQTKTNDLGCIIPKQHQLKNKIFKLEQFHQDKKYNKACLRHLTSKEM